MKKSHSRDRIDTTVGELIAAISDVAFEYSANTADAYRLTSLVLVEILKDASRGSEIVDRTFLLN